MRPANPIAIFVAAALAAAASLSAAEAATAHNSQAGALGPTTDPCAATAYFPADSGCLGSYLQHWQDDGLPPPDDLRARYRPRPPLQ